MVALESDLPPWAEFELLTMLVRPVRTAVAGNV